MGGGATLDIPINLLSLCHWCHRLAHDGNLTKRGPKADRQALLEIIARREGRTPDSIQEEIWLLLRTPRTYGKTAMNETATPLSLRVASIKIGKRCRKDVSRVESLAESMGAIGLVNPVTVNRDNELLCGAKRVYAAMYLGWETIDVRVMDAKPGSYEALLIEHDENAEREGWTDSERVELAKAIREKIGERQGVRSDLGANAPKLAGRTDAHIAEVVGLGSRETLARAEKVVDQGIPALVKAMDNGQLSKAAAAKIADMPTESQKRALKEAKDGKAVVNRKASPEVKEMVESGQVKVADALAIVGKPAAIQKQAAQLVQAGEATTLVKAVEQLDSEATDDDGTPLPPKLIPIWDDRDTLEALTKELANVLKGMKKLHNKPILGFMDQDTVISYLDKTLVRIKEGIPSTVCKRCGGDGCVHSPCFGHGWLPAKSA